MSALWRFFANQEERLCRKKWRIRCNESELIDSPEFCLIHVDPAHNARPHFHFRPLDFFSEINIGTRAVSPQAAASVGPLGRGNVILAIEPSLKPSSGEALTTVCVR